jgi:hypothetical protein
MALTDDQVHQLARHGARARILELEREIAAIRDSYPDQDPVAQPAVRRRAVKPHSTAAKRVPGQVTKRHWKMTPEQRQEVSERMKAYWANRRGAKKAKPGRGTP